jgi:signal transduction histidine kinase
MSPTPPDVMTHDSTLSQSGEFQSEMTEPDKKVLGGNLSIQFLNARQHLGIAISLTTILPTLAILAQLVAARRYGFSFIQMSTVFGLLAIVMFLGYLLLSRYPINIRRLRMYLEDMVDGPLPEKVTLLKSMDDMTSIERALNLLLAHLKHRVSHAEDELRQQKALDQLKDDFVSTVSHELRTPLAISMEGINLLLDGIPGEINEQQHKILTIEKRNLERLSRIINDLLDISKIEAGKLEIHREKVDICALAEQTQASMKNVADQRGLSMKLSADAGSLYVNADPDRIMQVLMNLVGNAMKFTEKGSVRTEVRRRDREIECAIIDTGKGIAQEDISELFNKFVQLGRPQVAGEKGTGLGLAISKNIVELHGGRIWVESKVGEGSRFTFSLPEYGRGENASTGETTNGLQGTG